MFHVFKISQEYKLLESTLSILVNSAGIFRADSKKAHPEDSSPSDASQCSFLQTYPTFAQPSIYLRRSTRPAGTTGRTVWARMSRRFTSPPVNPFPFSVGEEVADYNHSRIRTAALRILPCLAID